VNCDRAQRLVDAAVDAELDVVTAADLEVHFEECPECSWQRESRLAVRAVMRTDLGYRAPEALATRVRAAVRRAAEGEPDAAASGELRVFPAPARPRARAWLAVAATLLVAAGSVGVAWRVATGPRGDALAREAVASHVRSLMADHLTDVPSSDQHTVKPWFDGKIDFAPPVVDLADQDFALVGGRLDYVDDAPVAALVYQRRRHVINLFVRPTAAGDASDRAEAYKGYNVVRWTVGGMEFVAVSDLNAGELGEFASEIRSRTAAPRAP
jgi:anti-sigma factor RsiW